MRKAVSLACFDRRVAVRATADHLQYLLEHDDFCAYRCAPVKVDDILVDHANALGRETLLPMVEGSTVLSADPDDPCFRHAGPSVALYVFLIYLVRGNAKWYDVSRG